MAKVVSEVSQLQGGVWGSPTPLGVDVDHVFLITNTGQEMSLRDFFGTFKETAVGCGSHLDTVTSVVSKAYVDQQLNALAARVTALENATP